MKHYKTPRETSEILGISIDRLRRLAENGTISTIRTPGGQRRYDVQGYLDAQTGTDITTIGYCRVSGKGQAEDLASQVAYLQKHYPDAEIIKDFGSSINFKRKGLRTLLERKSNARYDVLCVKLRTELKSKSVILLMNFTRKSHTFL